LISLAEPKLSRSGELSSLFLLRGSLVPAQSGNPRVIAVRCTSSFSRLCVSPIQSPKRELSQSAITEFLWSWQNPRPDWQEPHRFQVVKVLPTGRILVGRICFYLSGFFEIRKVSLFYVTPLFFFTFPFLVRSSSGLVRLDLVVVRVVRCRLDSPFRVTRLS